MALTRTPCSASSEREALGQADAAELAGRVGRVLVAALLARLGVDLDDDAAVLRLHMPGRFFGGEEVAEQVDIHHGAPLLRGELGDLTGDQDAGVGHQDVQPAELVDRPGESGLD